jgi:hypothetical protein
VELPASLSAKILLLNEMIQQHVRPAELARRLKTTPQEVNRLTNVQHTSRIDGIAAALKALGKRLDMRTVRRSKSSARAHLPSPAPVLAHAVQSATIGARKN